MKMTATQAAPGPNGRWRFARCLLTLTLAWSLHAAPARAAVYLWTGAGDNNNWNTAENWDGGIVPVSADGTAVTFSGTPPRLTANQNVANPFLLNRLNIDNSGTGAFSITGSQLRFMADGGTQPVLFSNRDANSSLPTVNIPADTTLTADIATHAVTVGLISGAGGIIKIGGGTLIAPENNTFTGGWLLQEGTVSITTQSRLGGSGAAVTFDGGALQFTGGSTTIASDRRFHVPEGSGGLWSVASEVTIENSNLIRGAGTLALDGPHNLYVRSAQTTFTGTWHLLEGGVLRVRDGANRIGGDGSNVLFDGGTLRVTNAGWTLGATQYFTVGDGGGTMNTGEYTVTLGTANQLRGSGTLAKISSGELRINQPQPNFTGTWDLRAGTLRIYGESTHLGGEGSNVLFNGGTLRASTSGWTLGQTQYFTVGDGGGTMETGAYTVILADDDQLRGAGTLTKTADGTLVLLGDNSFSGTMVVDGGTLRLDSSLALQYGTVNLTGGGIEFGTPDAYTLGGLGGGTNILLEIGASAAVALFVGNNDADTTYGGNLSGTGSLTKIGSGVLTLTGANTYTGATTVEAGTLWVTGAGSLPNDASSHVLVASAGTTFDGNEARIVRQVTNPAGLGSQIVGPGTLGTTADVLAGTDALGGPLDVGMAWRMFDVEGGELDKLPHRHRPVSDVLRLTGMEHEPGTSRETDPFVLQMSYDPTLLTPGEEDFLYLGWLNEDADRWVNAVAGNIGVRDLAQTDVRQSWTDFMDPETDLADYLGSWGIDTTNAMAWAVLNHNSQFAVFVPEPGTWLLLLIAAACALLVRRRRR